MISEQRALDVMFYFGELFVLCRLSNRIELEWFLIIMYKEHTLTRATNFLVDFIPNYAFE